MIERPLRKYTNHEKVENEAYGGCSQTLQKIQRKPQCGDEFHKEQKKTKQSQRKQIPRVQFQEGLDGREIAMNSPDISIADT